MTKLQSPVDAAIAIVKDLEEFKRSSSKEAFRKQLGEEYVRRLGPCCIRLVRMLTPMQDKHNDY
jgi:hypothetical protein